MRMGAWWIRSTEGGSVGSWTDQSSLPCEQNHRLKGQHYLPYLHKCISSLIGILPVFDPPSMNLSCILSKFAGGTVPINIYDFCLFHTKHCIFERKDNFDSVHFPVYYNKDFQILF